MTHVVVDTDVVSYLFRGDSRASRYYPHLADRTVIISFMTSRTRNWGDARVQQLSDHLRQFVIHPYDAELCRVWADISHQARCSGKPIGTADAWIAATAVLHGLPLITHNAADFEVIQNLKVISAPD